MKEYAVHDVIIYFISMNFPDTWVVGISKATKEVVCYDVHHTQREGYRNALARYQEFGYTSFASDGPEFQDGAKAAAHQYAEQLRKELEADPEAAMKEREVPQEHAEDTEGDMHEEIGREISGGSRFGRWR